MSTTEQTVVPAGTWTFDPVHSSASFAVKHMVVSTFRGRFEDVEATLDAETQRLEGRVDVKSIVVKDPNLAGHLLAPDFFDAEQFPQVTFTSTEFRGTPEDLTVVGDLTVKGITKQVEGKGTIVGPTEDPFGGTRVGVTLETVVDRTAHGLDWNMELPKGGWALGNDVTITVELEFVKG